MEFIIYVINNFHLANKSLKDMRLTPLRCQTHN